MVPSVASWHLCGNCEWEQHETPSSEHCDCPCHLGKQLRGHRTPGRPRRPYRRGVGSAIAKQRIVRLLIERDGNACVWCKIELVAPWLPTIEHWVPKSLGGSNKLENLRLACAWCNRKRGVMDPADFYEWLKVHGVPPERRSRKGIPV